MNVYSPAIGAIILDDCHKGTQRIGRNMPSGTTSYSRTTSVGYGADTAASQSPNLDVAATVV